MNEARDHILKRLRTVRREAPDTTAPSLAAGADGETLIARFRTALEAVRGEVHRLRDGDWLGWLARELPARGVGNLLAGTGEIGHTLQAHPIPGVNLHRYDHPVEEWKDALFDHIDAGITGCRGAIAATGSLILWPSPEEPRLLSLVPPLHIVLLDAANLHADLATAIRAQGWAQGLPTNALLITGPSKTADIEQTLTWGIHGPRELVVLVLG